MQRMRVSGVLTVSPGSITPRAASTELGPMSKNNRASFTGLSIASLRSTGDFSAVLVARSFLCAVHRSEATGHCPVALLLAKDVGWPRPDLARSPEIVLVSLTTG